MGQKNVRIRWLRASDHSLTFLKNGPTPASFVYFRSFQTQSYRKTVFFSVIQTRIDGVEGEHVVHLTITTALTLTYFVRGSITLPTVYLLFDSFGFDQTSKSVLTSQPYSDNSHYKVSKCSLLRVNWKRQSMELSSRERWRLVSAQVVSCCVYKMAKIEPVHEGHWPNLFDFYYKAPWVANYTFETSF